jgi:hypothetical protein
MNPKQIGAGGGTNKCLGMRVCDVYDLDKQEIPRELEEAMNMQVCTALRLLRYGFIGTHLPYALEFGKCCGILMRVAKFVQICIEQNTNLSPLSVWNVVDLMHL